MRCALVLKPLEKQITELGTKKKKYDDDSDYTSEEYFDLLEKMM